MTVFRLAILDGLTFSPIRKQRSAAKVSMSNALQISHHLWQLKMGMVNAYLLETDDGLVLVDAGWPNKTEAIFKAVQESGHNPADIRHLVLTHGHIDHAGSAAEVRRRTGARSYAHAADLELINNGKAERPGTTVTPGIVPAIAYLLFIKPGGTTYESFAIDQTLKDGETLPMANDIEIIHSPGHCAGHIALLLRQEGILIAGDICSNIMGLAYSVLNEDRALARESLLRVAAHPFERAVFGHGKLLDKRANQLLEERFSDTKVR
ncbi:MAG: MBL fold metallo-hydrolase [Acidobacteriaceae bacterium]|nr:MBL fold metallo-hydrolase [Acidobacteriaceae bacterium]